MSILEKIMAAKREELAETVKQAPLGEVRAQAEAALPTRGFAKALRRESGPVRVIAEIKRASPSRGAIRPGADPVDIATGYEKNGAAAISVLTESGFFDGSLGFLPAVRSAVDVPLLRKDFIFDPYQVYEARANGADAVLLIVAALSAGALGELHALAIELGLDPLVEVHSEEEAEVAQTLPLRVLGVNHRNLKTFEMDMELSGRLRPQIDSRVVFVGESGIRDQGDLKRMDEAGVDAVLVGESLMRADDPGAALSALRGRA